MQLVDGHRCRQRGSCRVSNSHRHMRVYCERVIYAFPELVTCVLVAPLVCRASTRNELLSNVSSCGDTNKRCHRASAYGSHTTQGGGGDKITLDTRTAAMVRESAIESDPACRTVIWQEHAGHPCSDTQVRHQPIITYHKRVSFSLDTCPT